MHLSTMFSSRIALRATVFPLRKGQQMCFARSWSAPSLFAAPSSRRPFSDSLRRPTSGRGNPGLSPSFKEGASSSNASRPTTILQAGPAPQRPSQPTQTGAARALIVEVNEESFPRLMESSGSIPVVVDCYADWCDPCKQLTPRLERLASQFAGQFVLAKINADNCPNLVQGLNVKQLPTVIAISKGKFAGGFTGNVSDSQLKEFMDKVLAVGGDSNESKPSTDEQFGAQLMERARSALSAADVSNAGALFSQILSNPQLSKLHASALAGLAQASLLNQDLPSAQKIAEKLRSEFKDSLADSFVQTSLLRVDLLGQVNNASEASLLQLVESDPADHANRFRLAQLLIGKGQFDKGSDECFMILRKQRSWNDDAARKLLLRVFDACGPQDPLTKKNRSRLTNVLTLGSGIGPSVVQLEQQTSSSLAAQTGIGTKFQNVGSKHDDDFLKF